MRICVLPEQTFSPEAFEHWRQHEKPDMEQPPSMFNAASFYVNVHFTRLINASYNNITHFENFSEKKYKTQTGSLMMTEGHLQFI